MPRRLGAGAGAARGGGLLASRDRACRWELPGRRAPWVVRGALDLESGKPGLQEGRVCLTPRHLCSLLLLLKCAVGSSLWCAIFQNPNLDILLFLGREFLFLQIPTARKCLEMVPAPSPLPVMGLKGEGNWEGGTEWLVAKKGWTQGLCFSLRIFPLGQSKLTLRHGLLPHLHQLGLFFSNVLTSWSLFFSFLCASHFYVIS